MYAPRGAQLSARPAFTSTTRCTIQPPAGVFLRRAARRKSRIVPLVWSLRTMRPAAPILAGCWPASPLIFSGGLIEFAAAAHLGRRLLPMPTPSERLHRRFARRLVAVRRRAVFVKSLGQRPCSLLPSSGGRCLRRCLPGRLSHAAD